MTLKLSLNILLQQFFNPATLNRQALCTLWECRGVEVVWMTDKDEPIVDQDIEGMYHDLSDEEEVTHP